MSLYRLCRTFSLWSCGLSALVLWTALIHLSAGHAQSWQSPPISSTRGEETRRDSLRDTTVVEIIHADKLHFVQEGDDVVQHLVGHVIIRHRNGLMYCDSARIVSNRVQAVGNVRMVRADSIYLFADSLYYDGDSSRARLFGNVVLLDRERQLFTQLLEYDIREEIAHYTQGAILKDSATLLKSTRGWYLARDSLTVFSDSVVVVDTQLTLHTDSLVYHFHRNRTFFVAPTRIDMDSGALHCTKGWYDFNLQQATFVQRPWYVKDSFYATADTIQYFKIPAVIELRGSAYVRDTQQLARGNYIRYEFDSQLIYIFGNGVYREGDREIRGDTLFYDRQHHAYAASGQVYAVEGPYAIRAMRIEYDQETKTSIARRDVVIVDTIRQYEMHGDEVRFYQDSGVFICTGSRPWMKWYDEEDTTYIGADTLLSIREVIEGDTFWHLYGWYNVGMYSARFQGRCDSMRWHGRDSLLWLFNQPVLWRDTSEFSADTIALHFKKQKLDVLEQRQRAFIAQTGDFILFNQVKGRRITTHFRDGQPYYTEVKGNGEMVYYLKDENGRYLAASTVRCGAMKIYFDGDTIETIRFYQQPVGKMLPIRSAEARALRLEGFRWRYAKRPKEPLDVVDSDASTIAPVNPMGKTPR